MGLTYITAQVTGPTQHSEELKLLIDSGTNYTVLPYEVWRKLGLVASRSVDVELADGTRIKRSMSECKISFKGRKGSTPVILGKAGDEGLLGVITLEEFGFVLNPLKRTLQTMRVRM